MAKLLFLNATYREPVGTIVIDHVSTTAIEGQVACPPSTIARTRPIEAATTYIGKSTCAAVTAASKW